MIFNKVKSLKADGKVLKPTGWTAPDLKPFIQ